MIENSQIKLASRPVGMVKESNFHLEKSPVAELQDGEVLVKNIYISLDPAMRGWMNDTKSYIPPVQIDEVMRAGTAGVVLESKNPKYQKGDYVTGGLGVQEYAVYKETPGQRLDKVSTDLAPLSLYMSILGMTGMTAYFGILEVGQLKEGERVLVSGAAGAVGLVVGQIAKIKGCQVVGIAGGAEKCKYVVEELGFDACIDYKNESIKDRLQETMPEGIDVYFDNVGGDILDLALTRIRRHARIVICGAISQYNNTTPVKGPSNYLSLLVNRAKMEGFVVFDYAPKYMEAAQEMMSWIQQGKLKAQEHVVEGGVSQFHNTFQMLFSGQNKGKLLLKIADENLN